MSDTNKISDILLPKVNCTIADDLIPITSEQLEEGIREQDDKIKELMLIYDTVKGIMTCEASEPDRLWVLSHYAYLISLEADKHKMRTFLVATKAFKGKEHIGPFIVEIIEKLEKLTGKPII